VAKGNKPVRGRRQGDPSRGPLVGGYRLRVSSSKAPPVTLRPMTDEEYAAWEDLNARSFAAGIGPARGLEPDAALEYARKEIDKLLPDGKKTEGHLVWMACDADEPVGSLWVTTEPAIPFIFGIEVNEQHRGKGYGRSIMLAGEEECRRRGHQHLDLNVFGNNSTAISLYDSLGYQVVSQKMRKEL
jgi:ribosomal protein S18 acetylase RimI-like enzyme